MKNKGVICIALILFTIIAGVHAREPYTKKYHKEYEAGRNTEVVLNNKFGSINITEWDQEKVKIDVTVTVEAHNENHAEDIFEDIHIMFEHAGDFIKAETDITSNFRNTDFSIDYEVKMPAYIDVSLSNKYGDVFINKLTGKSEIAVKYGTLRANNLVNEKGGINSVYLGYSKNSRIGSVNRMELDIAYSRLEIEEAEVLNIESKYSKFEIGDTERLILESKYDTYDIGDIDELSVETKYSNYDIESVSSALDIDSKYTDIDIFRTKKDFKSIRIDNSYGKIHVNIEPGASYEIQAETEYCGIDYPNGPHVSSEKRSHETRVWGVVGNIRNPKSSVKVYSKYGGIRL